MHTAHTLGRAFRAVHASWHRIQSLRNPAAAPHGSPIKHCGGTERMKSGFFDGFTAKLAPMAAGRGPVHPPASGGAQERQPPDVSAPDAPPSPRGYGSQAGGAGVGMETPPRTVLPPVFPPDGPGEAVCFIRWKQAVSLKSVPFHGKRGKKGRKSTLRVSLDIRVAIIPSPFAKIKRLFQISRRPSPV